MAMYEKLTRCPKCEGSGEAANPTSSCPLCKGKGMVKDPGAEMDALVAGLLDTCKAWGRPSNPQNPLNIVGFIAAIKAEISKYRPLPPWPTVR